MKVGTVQELWRYPVKSMQGEQLTSAHVYWHGLDGDRRAAFVRCDNQSGFPWLTARQVPGLVRYQPRYQNPDDVLNSAITVTTPDGRTLPLAAPDLQADLAQAYGHDVSLIRIKRGVYDSLTVSLASVATAAALAEAVDIDLDFRRFRQNIVIKTERAQPFLEEQWVGSVLAIGAVRLFLNEPIPRCQMINVDPDTAVRDPQVLRMVAQSRDNCVGIGATPTSIGMIHVGDEVRLLNP